MPRASTAVYAGSFDPPTLGHLWMIERGAELFDHLVVAVGTNPSKRYAFPLDARLDCLRACVTGLAADVQVEHFDNRYLVDYAAELGAGWILRGIRNERDFGYEQAMRNINQDLRPELQTTFLMPPREIAEYSSSLVKGLIGPEGWREIVPRYLPAPALDMVLQQHVAD